jgi:predicted outer membrane repeat protein
MKNNYKTTLPFIALFLVGSLSNAQAATFYVKSGGSNGNGSSWSKAFNNLESALNAARMKTGSDQIWVAAGTYKPSVINQGGYSQNVGNLVTFNLPNDVAIYGGFAGNETALSQRKPGYNSTILSGDINGDDINNPSNLKTNKTDNAWHVLTADGVSGVLLDNLTVRGGYAIGPDSGTNSGPPQFTLVSLNYLHAAGGGLLARHGAKISLSNMKFEYNAADAFNAELRSNPLLGSPSIASGGGAIAVVDENTLATIKGSTFDRNSAFNFGSNGGAVTLNLESSIDVSTSTFTNNTADRLGGAIHAKDGELLKVSKSIFKNNTITGNNIGDESGGGIGGINTNITITTSYFEENASSITAGGGAVFFHIPFDDGDVYKLDVSDSVFNTNHGGVIGGGAINIFGLRPHVGSSAKITNCVFTGNEAIDGGALYIDSIPTNVSSSSFNNNQANYSGGAIFASNFGDAIFSPGVVSLANRKALNISNSVFTGNTIVGASPTEPPALFVFNLFASALSSVFGQPPSSVSVVTSGGGAIATELGGNTVIANCTLLANKAPSAAGGALLVGGSVGVSAAMNQSYLKISKSICSKNSATQGNNTAVLDPANMGNNPDGVKFITDGSCQ